MYSDDNDIGEFLVFPEDVDHLKSDESQSIGKYIRKNKSTFVWNGKN